MSRESYTPSEKIIHRYAQILVKFALNSGKGIKKNDVVQIVFPDIAKPLGLALQNTVLLSGGYPMIRMLPTGFDKDFFMLAGNKQLTFFPKHYLKSRVNLIDHQIIILADVDPFELKDVDPQKIMLARNSKKEYQDWLQHKEMKGKFTWTIALWGTEAKAKEVGLTLDEYWQQIINGCFLHEENPIFIWQEIHKKQEKIKKALNDLQITNVHIISQDADLTLKIGKDRIWNGGSGRNVPSFEIFTSPDYRGTEGWIRFNQPVYRFGNVIADIRMDFKKGLLISAQAKRGNSLLQELIKTPNANKIGEFSLTDYRMSHITHFMAETLFDENIGGRFGNTHIALGNAYRDCYRHDLNSLTLEDWEEIGFNNSAEHTDFISTSNRTVIATTNKHKEIIIYKNGRFTI